MGLRNWGRHVLLSGVLLASAGAGAMYAVPADDEAGVDGTTPLHQAVRQNDLKTVDTLIKRGADVKATPK